MTHDSQAKGSSRQAGRRHARPEPGRPSLFADFDQESVEDIEPQRIRLLSTLESQRGARARPRGNRRPTGRAHPWLTRALMVAMGLGMLVMLLSFIQLLRRPPPALPQPVASLATPGRQAATPERMPALSEAAEIIEISPPAAGPSPTLPTSPSASVMPAPRPTSTASIDPDRTDRTAKATPARQVAPRRDTQASPDDVALVEAMLAHAGPRKAPPSPTEALRQCGTGTSPETSVCRARICVQHPALAACHTP